MKVDVEDEYEYTYDYDYEEKAVANHTVNLWYQREDEGDFIVSIRSVEDGYRVIVRDEDSRDPLYSEHVFETYEHMLEYLQILHNQVLNDHDPQSRFTHFQYSIPFFPAIIVPVSYIRGHKDHYTTFQEALEYFFRST